MKIEFYSCSSSNLTGLGFIYKEEWAGLAGKDTSRVEKAQGGTEWHWLSELNPNECHTQYFCLETMTKIFISSELPRVKLFVFVFQIKSQ